MVNISSIFVAFLENITNIFCKQGLYFLIENAASTHEFENTYENFLMHVSNFVINFLLSFD